MTTDALGELRYGDRVICIDPRSEWYGKTGEIAGKNKSNLGVRFDLDPLPPATGRWISKSKIRLVPPPGQVQPWLREIIIHNNHCHRGVRIEISNSTNEIRHLALTGRNGSGKSTTLRALNQELMSGAWGSRLQQMRLLEPTEFEENVERVVGSDECVEPIFWDDLLNIAVQRENGYLLVVYIPATRGMEVSNVTGPEAIDWSSALPQQVLSRYFMQYLVNLRTEQAFAAEEGNDVGAGSRRQRIEAIQETFRKLLDEPDLELVFKRSDYRFEIKLGDRAAVDFEKLPDGYSSLIRIWAEISLLREAAKTIHPEIETWKGIVIIDELETHLHLELQESVFPLLTEAFPDFQFVISTHSPVILASMDNVTIYDLGQNKSIESEDLRGVPYGAIMTGHFGIASEYDAETRKLHSEWNHLVYQTTRTQHEQERLHQLTAELSQRSSTLALEVWDAFQRPELEAELLQKKS